MREILQKLVKKFNEKEDERKEKIKDLERRIVIKFSDDGTYYMDLKNGRLSDVMEGDVSGDIIAELSTETFKKILDKEEDALTAYITKKIKIKARLMDKLLLSELLR
ncbi:MAG: SCP2 sterol-binding domain-containing protein [Thermoplasmata archaeon]|nr:SCP2 sterol-binding domain-containing protein [Thermoplasmata archaeon]